MTEDAEVRNGTSSITRLAENSPSDMAEDAKVGGNGDGVNDETVKKSPLSKSNRPMGYFTSLRSDANSAHFAKRWVSLDSFGYGWGSQLEALPE